MTQMITSGEEGASGNKPPALAPRPTGLAPSPPLRVIVVDDFVLMRYSTRKQLLAIPGLHVIGEATDGLEAVALARTLKPDLVIMDVSMPNLDGIEATRRIKMEFPHMCVVMLSAHDGAVLAETARAAGAAGFISKGIPPGDFQFQLQEILTGLYACRVGPSPTQAGR